MALSTDGLLWCGPGRTPHLSRVRLDCYNKYTKKRGKLTITHPDTSEGCNGRLARQWLHQYGYAETGEEMNIRHVLLRAVSGPFGQRSEGRARGFRVP